MELRELRPAAASAAAPRFYRPELDALRFFAFALVFAHHMYFHVAWFQTIFTIGAFGVCMFFLLSAYLIVTILLREKERTDTVRLRAFAARRILRIWPLYFAVIALGYAIGRHWTSAYLSIHGVRDLVLLAGNIFVLRNGWRLGPISPLWSISVEEQFYLAVPFFTRIGGRKALTAICIAALAIAYMSLSLQQHAGADFWKQVWPSSLMQFQFFAIGGLIALREFGSTSRLRKPQRIALLLGGATAWYTSTLVLKVGPYGAAHHLIPGMLLVLAGTTMLFYAMLGAPWRFPRPLTYLGTISFGLYVFHSLCIWAIFENVGAWPKTLYFLQHRAVGYAVAMAATVLISMLSYHYFELPILRLKTRFEVVKTKPY